MPTTTALDNRAAWGVKSTALRLATASGVASLFRPLTRSAAVIFMLHRFRSDDPFIRGYEPARVRRMLEHLRRERYQLVDLETLFASLRGEEAPLRHAVAMTVDDGYIEHAEVGGPLFAEFECPVTTFVTTGFLDGTLWFWWDQIQFILRQTRSRRVQVETRNGVLVFELDDAHSRVAAGDRLTAFCTRLPDAQKHECIARLAQAAEVELPHHAPASFAPMSWNQLRACERLGMRFAPHTVTHPVLARTSDAQSRVEIVESWRRLREEATSPVPIFAYPNGQIGDFGDREIALLRQAGLRGAVTGVAGFATTEAYSRPSGEYLVPRFPFPDTLPYLIQQVDGLERFKFLLRRMD